MQKNLPKESHQNKRTCKKKNKEEAKVSAWVKQESTQRSEIPESVSSVPYFNLDNQSDIFEEDISSRVYQKIVDRGQVIKLTAPLQQVFVPDPRSTDTYFDRVQKGRYKRRVIVRVCVNHMSKVLIPCQYTLQSLPSRFNMLVAVLENSSTMKIFIRYAQYVESADLDVNVKRFVTNIAGGAENVRKISFERTIGNSSDATIIDKLKSDAQYAPAAILINFKQLLSTDQDGNNVYEGSLFGTIVRNSKGEVINVNKFIDSVFQTLENLTFFSTHHTIRNLRLDCDEEKKSVLRTMDTRSLLSSLWGDAVEATIRDLYDGALTQYISNEQIGILYNAYFPRIQECFNVLVMGNQSIIQPHPVKGLLNKRFQLMQCGCFDLVLYDQRQYGLNFIQAAYYLAKNMLVPFEAMTNNWGCSCFVGVQGSGKSKLVQLMNEFMGGYKFMDTANGIFEFQNYDIITKSFIYVDEVQAHHLYSSSWKQLSDLESAIKCRVKNKQDVEVSSGVSVLISGNFDVHGELLSKARENNNQSINAAVRRWGFIRYFDSWESAHSSIVSTKTRSISRKFESVYCTKDVQHRQFNLLMGIALTFTQFTPLLVGYSIPYYKHCLEQFAQTFFGQVYLINKDIFDGITTALQSAYQQENDASCYEKQKKYALKWQGLCYSYYQMLIDDTVSVQTDRIFYQEQMRIDDGTPMYYQFAKILDDEVVQHALRNNAQKVLMDFCIKNEAENPLFKIIKNALIDEMLYCEEDGTAEEYVDQLALQQDSACETSRKEKIQKKETYQCITSESPYQPYHFDAPDFLDCVRDPFDFQIPAQEKQQNSFEELLMSKQDDVLEMLCWQEAQENGRNMWERKEVSMFE